MDTGVQEGITSSLSRRLAYEQLAAYSQPSSWGLSQYKVLTVERLHPAQMCGLQHTDSQSLSYYWVVGKVMTHFFYVFYAKMHHDFSNDPISTYYPLCAGQSAKHWGYGSHSENKTDML